MSATRLALDCSTTGLSLALENAGKIHVFSTPLARSSDALPTELHNLLTQSNTGATVISHIYVTTGPGSFTGIRLGLAVAEALKLLNPALEIIGLSTLQAHAHQLAATHAPTGNFTVVLDAAGGQAYHQTFNANAEPRSAALCTPLTDLPSTPLYAEPTLLLHATPLHLLDPRHLLTLAQNPGHHLAPVPVYLKPLAYKTVH